MCIVDKHLLNDSWFILFFFFSRLGPDDIIIVLGSLLLDTPSNTAVYRNVSKIIPHPSYDHKYQHDVALLIMKSAVGYSTAIEAIPLSTIDMSDKTLCTVTGWGAETSVYSHLYIHFFNLFLNIEHILKDITGDISNALMSVNVQMVNKEQCNASYLGYFDAGMICAGNFDEGGVDACWVNFTFEKLVKIYILSNSDSLLN